MSVTFVRSHKNCNICRSLLFFFAGLFYFMLGNIHPKYRSRFQMIQLAAICKSENIAKYSLDAVLRPLIDDIKKLVCCRQ